MNRSRLAAANNAANSAANGAARDQRVRGVALWVCMMSCAAGVSSQAQPSTLTEAEPWPEVETVRTLMRADAAAALADCRMPGLCQPTASAPALAETAARTPDDIRVAAIFGSTKRLSIDVWVNGTLLRYRAGHGAPIAGAVQENGYQLLAVEGACVHLRRGDLDRRTCLDAGRAQP